MTEGIRKRGEKYSFRINVKDPLTGNWRNIERGGFVSVAEAKQARTQLLATLESTPSKVIIEDKKITLEQVYHEFIDHYAHYDREKSTLTRYDSLFRNHLKPRWGNAIIGKITPDEISEYLFAMSATHSYAYIMSIHKFIGVLWYYSADKKYMKENIFPEIKTPKAGSDEGVIKTYTQAQLDEFEKRFESTHSITAFKIGRATGVRCGECYGLLWSDIDWENHTMSISRQMVYEDSHQCHPTSPHQT